MCQKYLRGFPREDREDVLHNAYLRMVTGRIPEKFDPTKANFGGMVYLAARCAAIKFLRKRMREGRQAETEEEEQGRETLLETIDERVQREASLQVWEIEAGANPEGPSGTAGGPG